VLAAKGKLELGDALRCKVRYFTAGMIFGSRAFVNKVFASHRELFGQKRKSGARKMRGINASSSHFDFWVGLSAGRRSE
jgi:hypothetical protein